MGTTDGSGVPSKEQLPHSHESEMALLGAMLDGWRLPDLRIIESALEIVDAAKLETQAHKIIFNTIVETYKSGREVDLVTIRDRLSETRQLELAGGPDYLMACSQNTANIANVKEYAQTVQKKYLERRAIVTSRQVEKAALAGSLNGEWEALKGAIAEIDKAITSGKSGPPRLLLLKVGDLMDMKLPDRTHLFSWDGRTIVSKDALYLGDGLTRAGKGVLVGAALSVLLAAGGSWGRFRAIRPGRVVIVTVEDTLRRLQHRIGCFIRGLGLSPSSLEDRLAIIARPRGGLMLDNPSHVAELLDIITPFKPDYLNLDNLARMSEGDENTSEIRPAMEAADTIREVTGAAVVLVHHWGKDNEARRSVLKSRGWSGIPGFAEAHLTVTRPEGSETATLSHHDGKDDDDLALDFTLHKNDGEWYYDVTETPTAASGAPDAPRARVLAAVTSVHRQKRDGATVVSVAAETGLAERTVGEHLRALVELKAIRVTGKARSTRYYPAEQDHAGGSIGPPRDSREIRAEDLPHDVEEPPRVEECPDWEAVP